jgi:hypothetical protein
VFAFSLRVGHTAFETYTVWSLVVGDGETYAGSACLDVGTDVSTEGVVVDSDCGDCSFDIGGLCARLWGFTESDHFFGDIHVSEFKESGEFVFG